MQVRFPFEIDYLGRVASTEAHDEHVLELIEQVLFTTPGERVNRPDFGCGIMQLVHDAGSSQLASATSALVHAQLQRWLGDLIRVLEVRATTLDSELTVAVRYSVLLTGASQIAEFRRPV